jgi:uncharacterized oligopeptide transporter (OPT) family protein
MTHPEEQGETGLTAKSAMVAVALTLFLLATSIYISLRLGGLPWPIIFSVIASAGIMRALAGMRDVSVHQINVAQAGGTIGGLMASAVAFTVPGILFLQDRMGVDINMIEPYKLALVCVAGAGLGVLLSIPLRRVYVDEEQLPYASGTAGAEILKTQMRGGSGAMLIAFTVLLAGIFALTRDLYFPLFTFSALATYGVVIYISLMPLGVGIGYILGPRIAFNSWFGGAVVGSLAIVPYLVSQDWAAGDATSLVQNLGMGLVLGGGIGFFASYVLPRVKKIFAPLFSMEGPWYMKLSPVLSIASFAVLVIAGAPPIAALVGVLGVWVMSTVAARMTGETDIDPLEQFGIIVGLACIAIYSLAGSDLSYYAAFVIVIFVSVATAVAGDIGQDYKSAKIIGTRPSDIIKVDLLCAIIAGLAAPFILDIVLEGYADVLFTAQMPAPQAQLVAGSIFGFAHPNAFYAGFILAFCYEAVTRITKRELPFSTMAFGIGMFLGMTLGILLAVGGIIRHVVSRNYSQHERSGILVSAGLMGGEGIAGFLTAALFVVGIAYTSALQGILAAFAVILLLGIIYTVWNRR